MGSDSMSNFSYSDLSTYNSVLNKTVICMKKRYTQKEMKFLILGDLFHQCIDKASKGEDFCINDYEAKVKVGSLSTESGLLEYVVRKIYTTL